MQKAFRAFEEVRESGVTNMCDRKTVCFLAGINVEEYNYIIKNYDELKDAELVENTLAKNSRSIFMKYFYELDVRVIDGEKLTEFENDIYENGLLNDKWFEDSEKFIVIEPLKEVGAFFDYCESNDIQEFYMSNKAFTQDAENILVYMFINKIFQIEDVEFERTKDASVMCFKFSRKEVQ